MSKYLNEYKEFINQFYTVGSSLVFLRKDGYREEYFTGLKSIETNEYTPSDAIYRVASISKVIVAIGVLKLYEKGLIDLDLDISEYLGFKVRNPKYPDDKITIRMLMTQTSSINDEGDLIDGIYKGYDASNETDDYIKIEELLKPDGARFNKGFTEHKPGTNFLYSNFGCGILACICENITGKYFTEYIKEILLLPLGIKSGFRVEDIENKEALVSHYKYRDNKFILYRDINGFKKVQSPRYPLGANFRGVAGGLYISAHDLSKIMQMLMHKGLYNDIRILEEETVIEMEKVQWEGIPTDPTYRKKGLQMIIMDQFTEKPLYGHFGNAYGLRSFMLYNENGGFIFLCNGANFITDEDHMTILQEKLIKFLVDKTKI